MEHMGPDGDAREGDAVLTSAAPTEAQTTSIIYYIRYVILYCILYVYTVTILYLILDRCTPHTPLSAGSPAKVQRPHAQREHVDLPAR